MVKSDAFTSKPFTGNPAAVCFLPSAREDVWMQNVAREMNLSETAFLVRAGRRFPSPLVTPAIEVDLCGHATLASAHLLLASRSFGSGRTGALSHPQRTAHRRQQREWIEMDFPVKAEEPSEPPAGWVKRSASRSNMSARTSSTISSKWNPKRYCEKRQTKFLAFSEISVRGVILTARSASRRLRFCLALLRSGRRHERRSGHRLGALLLDPCGPSV